MKRLTTLIALLAIAALTQCLISCSAEESAEITPEDNQAIVHETLQARIAEIGDGFLADTPQTRLSTNVQTCISCAEINGISALLSDRFFYSSSVSAREANALVASIMSAYYFSTFVNSASFTSDLPGFDVSDPVKTIGLSHNMYCSSIFPVIYMGKNPPDGWHESTFQARLIAAFATGDYPWTWTGLPATRKNALWNGVANIKNIKNISGTRDALYTSLKNSYGLSRYMLDDFRVYMDYIYSDMSPANKDAYFDAVMEEIPDYGLSAQEELQFKAAISVASYSWRFWQFTEFFQS